MGSPVRKVESTNEEVTQNVPVLKLASVGWVSGRHDL
jgi:hypothetical protein